MVSNRTIRVAVLSILLAGTCGQAAPRNGRTFGGDAQLNPQQSRREQMRLEAQATYQEVKALLTEVLGAVSKNQRPSESLVQSCQDTLEENKQNALAYNEQQRADYMLLQAWTGYYQEDLSEALSWSMRACKQDEASQDAWNSQAVFNMLSGKRPLTPRIEKPKPATDMRRSLNPRPRRNNHIEVQKYDPEPYTARGALDLNLPAVRSELFRERFERMECRTTSGKAVGYVPGQDIFCALFYQSAVDVEDSDPNRPGVHDQQMPMTGSFTLSGYGSQSGAADINSQRQYFVNLMRACQAVPSMKFVQVDTLRPKDVSAVSLSSYDNKGIATIIAAHPDCNAKRLACDASEPFMMIVDKDGSVKYAGPAAGFAPAFILTDISGQPVSLESQGLGGMDMSPFGRQRLMRSDFGADPNAPAADPNQPQAGRPTERLQGAPGGSDFPGQGLMDSYDAQKLLQLAQLKIEQSRKLGSPEQGIMAARKVIEKYPNTPEAQQAKELLRRVPARYKQRFNITEEELL